MQYTFTPEQLRRMRFDAEQLRPYQHGSISQVVNEHVQALTAEVERLQASRQIEHILGDNR